MSLRAFLAKLFSNQRGGMQTATKTRTATSTRVKVAVTVGMIGLVAAAAYGFAFAPGAQIRRTTISTNLLKTPTGIRQVTGGGTGDTQAPLVGVVNPVVAQASVPVTLTATFSDAGTGVVSCTLTVDGANVGTMTLGTITTGAGTASRSYTFTTADTHPVRVSCTDAAGNTGNAIYREITVSAAPVAAIPDCGDITAAISPTFPSGSSVGADSQTLGTWTLTSTGSCSTEIFINILVVSNIHVIEILRNLTLAADSRVASINRNTATTTLGTNLNAGVPVTFTAGTPVVVTLTGDTRDAAARDYLRAQLLLVQNYSFGRATMRFLGLPISGNLITY